MKQIVQYDYVFTVFNAPSGRYLDSLMREATQRGLGCTIATLRLGTFRSKYQLSLSGSQEAIRTFRNEVMGRNL